MAYEIGYPVDFRSNGDTTKEAFSKHINEIKRIYSYLNDLEAVFIRKNVLIIRIYEIFSRYTPIFQVIIHNLY